MPPSELAVGARSIPSTPAADPAALHFAVDNGLADVVSQLLEAGTSPSTIARAGGATCTPLHLAFDGDIAELLLRHGAPIDARDERGRTPLMHTAIHNRSEVTAVLLAAGAAQDLVDNDGKTALDIARGAGSTQVIEMIKEADTGPKITDERVRVIADAMLDYEAALHAARIRYLTVMDDQKVTRPELLEVRDRLGNKHVLNTDTFEVAEQHCPSVVEAEPAVVGSAEAQNVINELMQQALDPEAVAQRIAAKVERERANKADMLFPPAPKARLKP